MKMKKSTIAFLVGALTCSVAVGVSLFKKGNNKISPKEEPEHFVVNESVEANDDVFGGGKSSLYAGEIGLKQHLLPKRLNNDPEDLSLTKPKIGFQYALSDSDSNNEPDHISIRFTAAINSLSVESATWTRAMFKENGDVYSGLTEGNKGVVKAYTGLTNGGVVSYASSLTDSDGNHSYNYFVVYTLLDIPLDGFGKYYLDASLTIAKGDNNVVSSVGAVEIDVQKSFSYERGTLSALEFIEANDRELSVRGKSDATDVDFVEIPAYANNGNGRYPVNEIESNGFSQFENLNELVVPEGLEKIGNYAFRGAKFSSVTLPSSLTHIGDHAFDSCINLTSVEIPSSVTYLGTYAFTSCKSLSSVNLQCAYVSDYCFQSCYSIESINYGNVTRIGIRSFAEAFNERSVDYIVIPSQLEYVGSQAYGLNWGLKAIFVEENPNITSWDANWDKLNAGKHNVIYGSDGTVYENEDFSYVLSTVDNVTTVKLMKYIGNSAEVIVPSQIDGHDVDITSATFKGNSLITKVTILSNINTIPSTAFSWCSNLVEVVLPNSVESIKDSAFEQASKLEKINMPTNLKNIGSYAFSGVGLVSIELPDGLETVDIQAIIQNPNLKEIYIPDSVTKIGYYAFYNNENLEKIYYEGSEIPNTWNSNWIGTGSENAELVFNASKEDMQYR